MLISALVHHQEGEPGGGVFGMAERKGPIPRGLSQMARWEWRAGHAAAVHGFSRSPRRR